MGPIDFRGIVPTFVGIGVAVGAAVVGSTWTVASFFNKAADPLVEVSAGRKQLMKEGFVGTQDQFKSFLSHQVDEYFKMNGYPCDPKEASGELAKTIARAKCADMKP